MLEQWQGWTQYCGRQRGFTIQFMNFGHLLDDARRRLLGLKERQKSRGDIDKAGEVDVNLLMKCCQIDLTGFGEIVDSLNASVEEDAVKVGMLADHALDKTAQILGVADIVHQAISLAAMLAQEVVDPVLSTANRDDFETFA